MRLRSAIALIILFSSPALAQQRTQYVLAISWQPAFCETRPDKPECTSQTAARFDASHFALHGLWPQPRSNDYCGMDAALVRADKNGDWGALPAPDLPRELLAQLRTAMPGTQSGLERHEWSRHGSCYGQDAEAYFTDALDMLAAINASAVADLFASAVGQHLTQREVRTAFDTAFGPGAGDRVRLSCVNDGNRRLIDELTIGLTGNIDGPDSFANRLHDARRTDGGCDGGLVDPVGLQ
ncbi:MAG: ribonuclease T2 family protein [Cypionkella sp.]